MHALRRAAPQEVGVRRPRACTRTRGPTARRRARRRCAPCRCRAPALPRGWSRRSARRTRRRGCCAARRTRTCPDGSTPPPPSPHGVEQRRKPLVRDSNRRRGTSLPPTPVRASGVASSDQRVDGDGPAVDDDQRVHVDRGRRRGGRREAGEAEQDRRPARRGRRRARRGTGRAASGWRGRRSARRRRGRRAGTSRNATSPSASASTPPMPSITHGPNCGSRTSPAISSRLPRTIGATSSSTVAVFGAGRGQQLARAAPADGIGVAQAEAHQAALGLVGDRVAAQLEHDRVADRVGRGRPRRRRRRAMRSSSTGMP